MLRVLLISVSVFILGCTESIRLPDSLKLSIDEYYESEKRKEWEKLYQFRRTAFQNTVSLNLFIREMDKYSRNFSLTDYKVTGAKISDHEAIIITDLKIQTDIPKNSIYAPAFNGALSSEFTEKDVISHWIKINDQWLLLDSIRMLQPLMSRVVYESKTHNKSM